MKLPVIETQEELQARALKSKSNFYRIWAIIGVLVLAVAVFYVMGILSAPVGIALWTVIIVFCLRGLVNKLEAKGVNRAAGTTIAYIVMFLVLVCVGLLTFSPMFGFGTQIGDLLSAIPAYIQSLNDWVQSMYKQYSNVIQNSTVQEWIQTALSSLSSAASQFAKSSAESAVGIMSGLANSALVIGLALVIAFWVLMELPQIGKECKRLINPSFQQDADVIHATFTRVMGGYIEATLIQCLIVGVGLSIILFIIGVPNAAAIGFIAGLFTIFPIIGPFIGGAVVGIVCIFVNIWTCIIGIVAVVVLENAVFTFVTPRIMANSVDVHPALSLFVIVCGSSIGTAMGGFTGALVGTLIAIPAVAVIKALFVYYFEKATHRCIVAEDGVLFKGTPNQTGKFDPAADATSKSPSLTQTTGLFKPVGKKDPKHEEPIDPYAPQTVNPNAAHKRKDTVKVEKK